MRKVRIGIDVGGTFTDAVAIDDATYEIIAQEKIPTTHDAQEGVADGIIKILQDILRKNNIAPTEVVFIAHGTTQATNALLEGDVAKVGILAIGSGLEAGRVKGDTDLGDIPLAQNKSLHTVQAFVETENAATAQTEIEHKIAELHKYGAEVIVASEAFSVDDPANELYVMELARKYGMYATGGHEVSQLYGLRVRTRTAVLNGSLIPKMMETADMTERCVQRSGIQSQLMIMRCDGGVMTIDEVRHRPILTMLSGLAAGVAGALMYERMSDGIFLEAGGTSTDISAICSGKVMIKYAQVGGHKTYCRSLDVRTLGVAGGSMIRLSQGKITGVESAGQNEWDAHKNQKHEQGQTSETSTPNGLTGSNIAGVGPRSAHIAGLTYEVFSPRMTQPTLELVAPCAGDEAVYVAVVDGQSGKKVALTLAGAANILGKMPARDYAAGDVEAARICWQALGDALGLTAEAAAQEAMDLAVAELRKVVEGLAGDYGLPLDSLLLAGGGGSGGVVVPYLSEAMGCKWKIVKNAPIISTIGVALAMVREVVERTVVNPTDADIRAIRREAMTQILRSGAQEATVEITIEIDKQANILRAVAMGATELNQQNLGGKNYDSEQLQKIAAESLGLPLENVQEIAACGKWHIFEGKKVTPRWLFGQKENFLLRVLDRDGVIRLRKESLGVIVTTKDKWQEDLTALLENTTEYGTIGGQLPKMYLYYGEKQVDLSGLTSKEQIVSLLELETGELPGTENMVLVATK